MYNKIQKLSDQDQQSILRREIKFKKLLFSDLPSNFSLFKQYNIPAKVMYQNLLKFHAVDEVNKETISVEDIYKITDRLSTLTIRESKSKSKISAELSAYEEDFVIILEEQEWSRRCVQS